MFNNTSKLKLYLKFLVTLHYNFHYLKFQKFLTNYIYFINIKCSIKTDTYVYKISR